MVRKHHLYVFFGVVILFGLWRQTAMLDRMRGGTREDARLPPRRASASPAPEERRSSGQLSESDESGDDSGASALPQSPTPAATRLADGVANADVQLFVVWPGAMAQRNKILHDISKTFRIFRVVNWTPDEETLEEDLWRLYWGKGGFARKGMKKKVQQCGGYGRATMVLVVDPNPKYKTVSTAHGDDFVNENMHKAKYKYRGMSGGGFKVHGTYSVDEAQHDAFVLLGRTAREILQDTVAQHGSVPAVRAAVLREKKRKEDTKAAFEDGIEVDRRGQTFGFAGWPSCERLYRAVALVTDASIKPSLAACQLAESENDESPPLRVETYLPHVYDKTLDIRAAIVAMVYGSARPERHEAVSGTISRGTHELRFNFVLHDEEDPGRAKHGTKRREPR